MQKFTTCLDENIVQSLQTLLEMEAPGMPVPFDRQCFNWMWVNVLRQPAILMPSLK